MKYCAKHKFTCKHIFQSPTGSSCGYDKKIPVKELPLVTKEVYGDIKAPEWCPLQEVAG